MLLNIFRLEAKYLNVTYVHKCFRPRTAWRRLRRYWPTGGRSCTSPLPCALVISVTPSIVLQLVCCRTPSIVLELTCTFNCTTAGILPYTFCCDQTGLLFYSVQYTLWWTFLIMKIEYDISGLRPKWSIFFNIQVRKIWFWYLLQIDEQHCDYKINLILQHVHMNKIYAVTFV